MEFPIIRVKNKGEKDNGFIVGTNHHHKLILDENGNIKFVNIQCMDATGKYSRYGYEFVTKKGMIDEEEISFGTVWDMLNIYAEHIGILDNQELTEEFNNALKKLEDIFIKSNMLNIYVEHIGILDNQELTEEFNNVITKLEDIFIKSNNLKKLKKVESDKIVFKYLNELEVQIRFMAAIERRRKNKDESYYKSIPQISKEIGIEPSDYCDYRVGRKKLPEEIIKKIIKIIKMEKKY